MVMHFDWSFARLTAPVVTTISITLSSNKIQNGDILASANPGPPGKWSLKRREKEYKDERETYTGAESRPMADRHSRVAPQRSISVPSRSTLSSVFT